MKIEHKKLIFFLIIIFISFFSILNAYYSEKYDFGKYYDINGNKINVTNKSLLVILVNPKRLTNHTALFYAEVVKRRYKDIKNLGVIGVCSNDEDKVYIRKIVNEYRLDYPIILDKNGEIFKYFGVCANCGGVAFIKNNTIRQLISPINSNNDIRQIVEWELFNKVSKQIEPIQQNKLTKGKTIEWLNVWRTKSKQKYCLSDLINKPSILTFYSSMCGFCKTGRRLNTIKALKEKFPKIKIISVFLTPFRKEDLTNFKVLNLKIIGDIYFSENFFSNDELYLTNSSIKKDPFSIIINNNRTIVYVEKDKLSEKEFSNKVANILKEEKHEK
jgi:peroxiredoxin